MYGQEERTYRRYAPQAELMNPAARDLNGSSVQLSHVSLSTPSFFTFNLPRSPSLRSLSLCLSGCKVIKLSCFILDAIQRSDTLESWLWHALATHTHLTHTPFCAAQTSMCRGQVSFMFMLSISRRPALWLSDWREIIVIAALSHRDKRWIESWKHEFNLVFFYDIISSMIAFRSLALWVTDRLSQLWSNNII